MPRQDPANPGGVEVLFLESLPLIARIIRSIARRYRLDPEDEEEFGSLAKERLIENGYAVLASFEGRSSLGTWLTVVLVNLFRDYRNEQWGRWRPSKTARRLGAVATQLDILTHRDGHSPHEAIAIMRARDPQLEEGALLALHARLPSRLKPREVGLDQASGLDLTTDPAVLADLESEDRAAARAVLTRTVEGLPAEERLILRMRYWDGLPIAHIARALHLDEKTLYPRLKALQADLRRRLQETGLTEGLVAEYFGAEPGPGLQN